MRGRLAFGAVAGLTLLGAAAAPDPGDRLERFAEQARQHLAAPAPAGSEAARRAVADTYALVDAEILDSLQSGEPFSSLAFLQERLDGFAAVWGGAVFRVIRLDRRGGAFPLTLGLFNLSGVEGSGSLHIYGWVGPTAALLTEVSGDGAPEVFDWPAPRAGGARFVIGWAGAESGRGSRALRVEVWGASRGIPPRRLWSSEAGFPDGLWALDWSVKPGEIRVRRELRYPGWKPGCPDQAEEQLVYRDVPGRDVSLVRRQLIHGWHKDLGAAAAQLFEALSSGDRRALATLVPDRALRERVPPRLIAESGCDQPRPPAAVSVAATAEVEGRRVPWSLTWSRGARGWRLTGAAPVLQ